jgi:hypothetical protein
MPSTPVIKGINYTKGKEWLKNYHSFTRKELINDFTEMKKIGIEAIKWYGPGIYDLNVFRAAKEKQIKINYSYWIPEDLDFLSDPEGCKNLREDILESVNSLKNNSSIISWNIGNATYQLIPRKYYKPESLYQREAYIKWLRQLVVSIKKADPKRSVAVDILVEDDLVKTTNLISSNIPEIDSYGLIVNHNSDISLIKQLKVDYFFSKITAKDFISHSENRIAYISNWQDEETADYVSLDGIRDKWGRNKTDYYKLARSWRGTTVSDTLPPVKILLPAITPFESTQLTYHALLFKNGSWITPPADESLEFRWALVKNDKFENTLSLQTLGSGKSITINIPKNQDIYSLYLYVNKGNKVNVVKSKLNTPLY